MRRFLPVFAVLLLANTNVQAHGLLIPADKTVPPLAMLNHNVTIDINDQVAQTRVEQTFRNHTDRQLEATYVFPIPKGANVNKFSMWIDGKEVKGELLEADKARAVYTEIVRQTQDPGLLEYMGTNMMRMRVFPVLPKSDQKVALSYSYVAPRDANIVEYTYPLKTSGKAAATLEKFSIKANIKAQHPIQNVYSPTHAINLSRPNDKEVSVSFERDGATLDKDFVLFYSMGDKDVGLTFLAHRPIKDEKGFFTMLISPRVEISKENYIPRDVVLVLDTSGSMRNDGKIDQAKNALKYCLNNLGKKDRFALINFSTTVNKYRDKLVDMSSDQLESARKWIDNLDATGGTAIDDALKNALDLRTSDDSRTFTVIFFTDGQPTIGETDAAKILKNAEAKNSANTRIFTFGVGDDVNAQMLDQLADKSKALSCYVRPSEDIEAKVSSMFSKMSHPVLANLKLKVGDKVQLSEIYPTQLPDLFHGGQLVVFGRYEGNGPVAITLSGTVGKDTHEYTYETTFPDKTKDDREFVEQIWARRKVGFLLDQIRANGEKKELLEETITLAKKYGIATPYTSYLLVPDNVVAGLKPGKGRPVADPAAPPVAFRLGAAKNVADFAKQIKGDGKGEGGGAGAARDRIEEKRLESEASKPSSAPAAKEAQDMKRALDDAKAKFNKGEYKDMHGGKVAVDYAVQMNCLRNLNQVERSAQRNVNSRECLDVGGVWIDQAFDAKMKTVNVKAMSEAYFRILEKNPKMKEVFQLGNHLVWVTPSNVALIIDPKNGDEKLTDAQIEELFKK